MSGIAKAGVCLVVAAIGFGALMAYNSAPHPASSLSTSAESSSQPSQGISVPSPTPPQPTATNDSRPFRQTFDQAVSEEAAGIQLIESVTGGTVSGPAAVTALNAGERHIWKAADLIANAGPSPFGDIGANMLLALNDEDVAAQALLIDWWEKPTTAQADLATIRSKHDLMATYRQQMTAHGL